MREHIKLIEISNFEYEIIFIDNGVKLGKFIKEMDGYFYWDIERSGIWSDYVLLEIGNKLKKLNKDWDKQLQNIL